MTIFNILSNTAIHGNGVMVCGPRYGPLKFKHHGDRAILDIMLDGKEFLRSTLHHHHDGPYRGRLGGYHISLQLLSARGTSVLIGIVAKGEEDGPDDDTATFTCTPATGVSIERES